MKPSPQAGTRAAGGTCSLLAHHTPTAAPPLTYPSAPAAERDDSGINQGDLPEQQPDAGDLRPQASHQQQRRSLAALKQALQLAAGSWLQQLGLVQDGTHPPPGSSSAHLLLQQLPLQQQLPLLTTLLQAVGSGAAWDANTNTMYSR